MIIDIIVNESQFIYDTENYNKNSNSQLKLQIRN